LLIKFQGARRQTVHVLVMEPLGMATSDAQEARDSLFGDVHEPGGRPDATAFIKMVDHLLGFGLRQLRVKQGSAAPLREFFPTGTTAQQANTIVSIDLADDEVAAARLAKQLAFSIDTR
jgi:hypothetical protein